MKIQNIIGNPPFQDVSNASNGRKLYLDITQKMIDLHPDNLIFLTPSTIANDKIKRLSLKDIKGLKEVNYNVDNYFDVGVHIILFHIQNNYNGNVKIIEEYTSYNVKPYESVMKKVDIIPNKMFNKIKIKGSEQKDKLFIGDVSSNGKRQITQDDYYKYKVHINTIKNKVEYTFVKPKLYGKKKIAIHMGKTYNKDNYILSTENYGQYQNMIDVDNYTDTQIKNIKSFLFNDLIVLLCKRYREFYGTGFNNIIYFFTNDIDINKYYNDKDIIDFFSFSIDEINYLRNGIPKISSNVNSKTELNYAKNRNERVKETAEIFTPSELVNKIIEKLDINETFLDPTCGSGNFLVELALKGTKLCNLYGVDLMEDNIQITKKRLTEIYKNTMSTKDIESHLNRNIICADALTYHYEFWWRSKSIINNDW